MRKFLRVVAEGLVDGRGNPVTSDNGQAVQTGQPATAKPQVDPKTYKVPNVEFLKKNYKHPADVIDGSHPSTTDPARIGAWAADSDFADLMMALNGSYYQARQADPNFQQPGFVKDDWELVQRMLGTPEGKEYAIAQAIGLSNIDDKSDEAEFNRAQHKEFEKQANAKLMQQPNGVVAPGWKYDQKLGMTPAQAELQKQKAQQPVAEEVGMSRLLSIITEGRGPLNRPTTAESITMQHYTTPVQNVIENASPSIISKYFKAVEQELKEAAERPNERAQQLAKRVITGMNEGLKDPKDNPCWTGYKPVGTKKKAGKTVPNCVPKESVEEDTERCMQCGMKDCSCPGDSCKCKPIKGWIPGKGFKKAVDEAANAAQQAAIAIAKRKQVRNNGRT